MVSRSCGKDGCKASTRQSLGTQLRERQGKRHSCDSNFTPQPSHLDRRWYLWLSTLYLVSMAPERDLQNRAAAAPAFFFWGEKTTALPDMLGCCLAIQFPRGF